MSKEIKSKWNVVVPVGAGICRICRGKHQAAMKFVPNVSPPQEQREEQSSAELPMGQDNSTIADPQVHVRFLLPPEEPSSEVMCT